MKIEQVLSFAQVIQQLLEAHDPESTVCITDREKFIYASDKLDLGIHVGDMLQEGSMMLRTIKEGEPVRVTVDSSKSVYKHDYTCVCIPIFDNGTVCGSIGWGMGTQQFQLQRLSQNLHDRLDEVNASAEAYSQFAVNLVEIQNDLVRQMEALVAQAQAITNVNTVIQNISETTNIIGLNAAIEASRAGDAGRTFGVVASEIRALAKQSKQATENIETISRDILQKIDEAFAFCNQMTVNNEHQAAGAEELSASVKEIQKLATTLYSLASDTEEASA